MLDVGLFTPIAGEPAAGPARTIGYIRALDQARS